MQDAPLETGLNGPVEPLYKQFGATSILVRSPQFILRRAYGNFGSDGYGRYPSGRCVVSFVFFRFLSHGLFVSGLFSVFLFEAQSSAETAEGPGS